MNGLYQKVQRGLYDPLPSSYSSDLQTMVKNCLQVQPSSRPSCDKILGMPSIASHMSEKLEESSFESDHGQNVSLLSTIRLPRDLGQITERLPKAQYGNVMRRNKSLPAEKMERLPDIINKKDILLPPPRETSQASMNIQPRRLVGGLANKVNHSRQISQLAIIEEDDLPLSRERSREEKSRSKRPSIQNHPSLLSEQLQIRPNPNSAQPDLNKVKAHYRQYLQIPAIPIGLHESKTPHQMKVKAILEDLHDISNKVSLPKIHSTRGRDIPQLNLM